MESITQQQLFQGYQTSSHAGTGLWARFMNYTESQENNRLLWLAIGVGGHGTVFTIITLATVLLTGNIFALFITACCAMVAVVVVNLAALPTKITIPVFFISLLVDIAVIVSALALR